MVETFYAVDEDDAPQWGRAEMVAELLAGVAGILLASGYSGTIMLVGIAICLSLAFHVLVAIHADPWHPSRRFPQHPFRGVFGLVARRVTQGVLVMLVIHLWIVLD